jgi:hypothetical protein
VDAVAVQFVDDQGQQGGFEKLPEFVNLPYFLKAQGLLVVALGGKPGLEC